MKMRTKLKKLMALVLSMLFVLGSLTTAAFAADDASSGASVTDKTLDDVKRLLNASSYDEYTEKH